MFKVGQQYDLSKVGRLVLIDRGGFDLLPDDPRRQGVNVFLDFFDDDGVFLGPNTDGVQPVGCFDNVQASKRPAKRPSPKTCDPSADRVPVGFDVFNWS
jgi:hypothetical protein